MAKAVRWKFFARRTRQQRQQQRKSIVLKDAGITPKTQERYLAGLAQLLPILVHINNLLQLDEAICQWIQTQWENGESIHIVSDALCGLHFFEPWTKRGIPTAWRIFSTWRKLESPSRAPPLTSLIVYALSNYAVSQNDLHIAAMLLIGFFGLLRTGEMLKLCPADILLGKGRVILSLHDTKSGRRDNVSEMVTFEDEFTFEILSTLLDIRKRQKTSRVPLWMASPGFFRNEFKRYLHNFDLDKHQFRPYSLRRGGATWVFQETGSMEAALLKGRWGSSRVARIYISDALSFLPGLTHTFAARKALRQWNPFQQ